MRGDNEPPPHVKIFFGRSFRQRRPLWFQRHAANRAGARPDLFNLRMHGTGVDEVLAALGDYGRRVAKEYLRPCFKPLPAFCRAEIIFPAIVLCRSEEHTSELQSLMRISYAVFC